MVFLIMVGVFVVFGGAYVKGATGLDYIPPDYLAWNYTYVNENCTGPGGGRNPCQDIRVCNFAFASIMMSGWPTLCGWVGKGVPKVCCGLPLVLGKGLMAIVNEEKARKRECGRKVFSRGLSETENKFFEILQSLPPIDISNPNKFDPPLDLTVEPMTSSVVGNPSRQGDFPWMVEIDKGSSLLCEGTLIDRVHILAAAHCFVTKGETLDPSTYTVRIGNIFIDRGHPFSVSEIIVHENYNPNFHYNDIAILKLDSEILIPQIAHICLPNPEISEMDLTGQNTTLLEWEDTEFGRNPVLHIVDYIPIMSTQQCREAYANKSLQSLTQEITDDFVCARLPESRNNSCKKGSGGLLMYKNNYQNLPDYHPDIPWVLVGVASSFGVTCGQPGYPDIYTKISSYMDWIVKNTNMPPQTV